ncbi:MAG: O-antigen ligase family protein [Anaerolineae bacterium]|nr:O-antigen ligase family protein [Anaerolineae bacterium]
MVSLSTLTPALTPSGLFLLTALVGVWAAYDRTVAWSRFGLIAGGLLVALGAAWAGQRGGERALGAIGLTSAILAAAIGAYFLLMYDWTTINHVKFATLQQLGLWLQAHRLGLYPAQELNPNLVAGGLVVLLPLGMGGTAWGWRQRYRRAASVGALALCLGLLALVLTASRGAWLGLGLGLLAAGYLEGRPYLTRRPFLRRLGDGLLIGGLLAALIGFGLALTWPNLEPWLDALPRGATAIARLKFWRDSLSLIGDYPLTGSGLGSTEMVYSSYVLLLHVGYIDRNVHNLFLQIAVEQGLPGLAAFLGLLGLALGELLRRYRRRDGAAALRWAATAAVIALLVQGLGEAGNYNGPPVLIGFLPLGFAWGCARQRVSKAPRTAAPILTRHARLVRPLLGLVTVLALALLLLPTSRAAFRANLGAVAQTRAELSLYHWPEWPIQDAVRRSPQVNLAPAIAYYQSALALDPANVTANRRLGQIELSLGEYHSARQHLESAYAAAPGQRATRQLLGEAYALAGEIERAAALWQTLDVSEGQLTLRQRWYASVGEPEQGVRIAKAAARSAGK